MKLFVVLAMMCVMLTACPGSNPSNPPTQAQLAPGYQNAADQQMGEILSGAHAFYNSIQQQSQAGTLTLDATTKQAFNTFGIALNSAQQVYLAYHNGQATQAQAQTAVNQVQSQQAALPLPGAK
jgi:hypothetical protein